MNKDRSGVWQLSERCTPLLASRTVRQAAKNAKLCVLDRIVGPMANTVVSVQRECHGCLEWIHGHQNWGLRVNKKLGFVGEILRDGTFVDMATGL